MTKDDQWNINIMLVGYGGDRHSWGFLADSILVASYNPTHHSVSMISIPRDMIMNDEWRVNKINTVFANRYSKTKDLSQSAHGLADKLTEILWLEIPYYALIDFNGFEQLIDTLWGLEIDIPKAIVDYKYPW
jgi:anionic cell wall polymer biosynthesis LytR-Cps2A-Psr (LCP) family protein